MEYGVQSAEYGGRREGKGKGQGEGQGMGKETGPQP